MINNSTTFILGAGASYDYGFPLGKDLLEDIINFLYNRINIGNPNITVGDANNESNNIDNVALVALLLARYHLINKGQLQLLNFPKYRNTVNSFANNLLHSSTNSIDDFIAANSKNEDFVVIGKICIAVMISIYEKKDKSLEKYNSKASKVERYKTLLNERNLELDVYTVLENDWYRYLWGKLYDQDIEKLKENLKKLTFITFNYDRSLENFLFNKIKAFYGIEEDDVAKILNDESLFKIHHIYGKLGNLPWQETDEISSYYGELCLTPVFERMNLLKEHSFNLHDMLKDAELKKLSNTILLISLRLKTYYELSGKHNDLIGSLFDSFNVVFLGYGFHDLNMQKLKKLKQEETDNLPDFIGATTYGLKESEIDEIKKKIGVMYKENKHISGPEEQYLIRAINMQSSNYNILEYLRNRVTL
jgi:hypothetical protein